MQEKEPLILAIDTSGAYVSVALMTPPVVHAVVHEWMDRGQAERLMLAVDEVMRSANRQMRDLTAIAVAVGPGSFTGVRIALASARGLGLALDIPVWGVTNFEALAYDMEQPVRVILDTRRDDFYIQDFDADGRPESEACVMSVEALKKSQIPLRVGVGDGASKAMNIACHQVIYTLEPHAERVGHVAWANRNHPRPAEAMYLREADVTLPRR